MGEKNTPKNIILSSDGTGNSGGKKYDTNVWRIHTALDKHRHKTNPYLTPQLAFYHDGVGTDDNKLLKLAGGTIGFGLSRIIIGLYVFLVNNYEPGDKIYLFGFSRGAYAVRLLAGIITQYGVPKKQNFIDQSDNDLRYALDKILETFKRWQNYKKQTAGGVGSSVNDHYSIDVDVHPGSDVVEFIGVWDTVDAYGIPSDFFAKKFDKIIDTSFRYHDRTLPPNVLNARHALSIDDRRRVFSPVLWDETQPGDKERIKQVWFAGSHSNVGGGYPKQGMAWVSLEWMMCEAEAAGLRFVREDLRQFTENKDPHDRLYDSRAGFAQYYAYKERNIWELVNEASQPQVLEGIPNSVIRPLIHESVFERIRQRTQEYSPDNIPADFTIVQTQHNSLSGITTDQDVTLEELKAPVFLNKKAELKKGFLPFVRRYSAYLVGWGQFLIAGLFALLLYYCVIPFGWISLMGLAFVLFIIGFLANRGIKKTESREERYYSTFWRSMESALKNL